MGHGEDVHAGIGQLAEDALDFSCRPDPSLPVRGQTHDDDHPVFGVSLPSRRDQHVAAESGVEWHHVAQPPAEVQRAHHGVARPFQDADHTALAASPPRPTLDPDHHVVSVHRRGEPMSGHVHVLPGLIRAHEPVAVSGDRNSPGHQVERGGHGESAPLDLVECAGPLETSQQSSERAVLGGFYVENPSQLLALERTLLRRGESGDDTIREVLLGRGVASFPTMRSSAVGGRAPAPLTPHARRATSAPPSPARSPTATAPASPFATHRPSASRTSAVHDICPSGARTDANRTSVGVGTPRALRYASTEETTWLAMITPRTFVACR